MSRDTDREVFRYCAETCPEVDGAFNDLLDDIRDTVPSRLWDEVEKRIEATREHVKKEGTYKLRDALREAVSDKQDVEREKEDLEHRVQELESEVESLNDEISDLEKARSV